MPLAWEEIQCFALTVYMPTCLHVDKRAYLNPKGAPRHLNTKGAPRHLKPKGAPRDLNSKGAPRHLNPKRAPYFHRTI